MRWRGVLIMSVTGISGRQLVAEPILGHLFRSDFYRIVAACASFLAYLYKVEIALRVQAEPSESHCASGELQISRGAFIRDV